MAVWNEREPRGTRKSQLEDFEGLDEAGGGGGGQKSSLQLSTWGQFCISCNSSSRPKGAYGTTDEDRFVLTCACSCD